MRSPKLVVLDADRDLSQQVERAVATLRPRPEVVHAATIEALDGLLAEGRTFELLVAGASVGDGQGLQALRQLRARMPEAGLILAFDQWRSSSLRETVRTGALDILRLPAKDEVVADAIEQALDLRRGLMAEGHHNHRDDGRPPTVVAVISATGGCGKTFFSTNLAYHLQARLKRQTCLIDLDLQFGELSTALRLRPRYTIADLAGHGDDEDLPRRLVEISAVHDTGIHVLAAPDEPAEADRIDAVDVARIIEAARSKFDAVVIDTPASLSEGVLGALEYSDLIFCMATLDLPSVRNLGVLLKTLDALKVPADRVQLVLNKVEPDVGIDITQVSKYFPQGFSIIVPYGREANRALNMGVPVLAYAPRCEISKVLADGLNAALPIPDSTAAKRHRLPRLGRRAKSKPEAEAS